MYRCWRRKRSKSLPKFSEESLAPEPTVSTSRQSSPKSPIAIPSTTTDRTHLQEQTPKFSEETLAPEPTTPQRRLSSPRTPIEKPTGVTKYTPPQPNDELDRAPHNYAPNLTAAFSNETVTFTKQESYSEAGYETIDHYEQTTALAVSTDALDEPSTSKAQFMPESSKEDLYSKPMKKVRKPPIAPNSLPPGGGADDENETMEFSQTDSSLSTPASLEEQQRKSIDALQTLQKLKNITRNDSIVIPIEKAEMGLLQSEVTAVSVSPTVMSAPKDSQHLKEECLQLWQRVHNSQTSLDSGFPRQFDVIEDLCQKQHQLISFLNDDCQKLQHQLNCANEEIAIVHQTKPKDENDQDLPKNNVHRSADAKHLEELVCRLTAQLDRYQTKYEQLNELASNVDADHLASWPIETSNLLPLFLAYDSQLTEKNESLKQYEQNFACIKQELEVVHEEHNRLKNDHAKAEDNWKALYKQAELVLEENTRIIQKRSDMHEEHKHQVHKLADRLMTLENEKSVLEKEIIRLQNSMQQLQTKCVEQEVKLKKMLPMEEYLETVKKFDRNTNKLKDKCAKELAQLDGKLQASRTEQKSLSIQIADLKAAKCQQEGRNKALSKMLREAQNKAAKYERQYENTVKEMAVTGQYLGTIQDMAGQVSAERQTYIKLTQEQYNRAQQLMNELEADKLTKAKLHQQLKHYKSKMKQKAKTTAKRARKNTRNILSKFHRCQKRNKQLRRLLDERNRTIESLLGERRRVEEDLDRVWRYAANENKEMHQKVLGYNR